MILIELLEEYDPQTGKYMQRNFFTDKEGVWEYLTAGDDTYTYLGKKRPLTISDIENAIKDIRHTRTLTSGNGKRYSMTSYLLTN